MKLLDKCTDKLTDLLLDYIRRKNGRGWLCRFLRVDEDFMIALRLEDLKNHKCKISYISGHGPVVALGYSGDLVSYLHLHDLMYGTEYESRGRCNYCVFYEDERCTAPTLSAVSPCYYCNGKNEVIVFMRLTSFMQLMKSCKSTNLWNQSLFLTSYIRNNTACLSVKR